MTTPTSPDGPPIQTATTNPTTSDPASGDEAPIRNWGDVKKLLGEVVPGREEIKELRTLVEAIGGKLETLAAPKSAGDTPTAPATTGIEGQLAALATTVQGIVSKEDRAAKQERRAAITAAVAGAASEAHRDLIRGALATLALDGAVDLHAEDATAEAARALGKLRALHPGAFATAGPQGPAPSGSHDIIPAGVQLHELTAEQLARISDEDFSKIRRAARTSNLAV